MDDIPRTATLEPTVQLWTRPRPRRAARFAVLAIFAAGIAAGATNWWLNRDTVSTNDAFIDGRAVQLSSQVAGQVVVLAVHDNQRVEAGALILQVDSRPFEAAHDEASADLRTAEAELLSAQARRAQIAVEAPARLEQAKAQVTMREAALAKAEADWRRQKLMPRAATTLQDVDAAAAARLSAQANLATARAAEKSANTVAEQIAEADSAVSDLAGKVALARARLETAALRLSWTRLTAPRAGWIAKRAVEVGDYVQPGQAVLALVLPARWVTANFKESDLAWLKPGQAVNIAVDAYPDLHLKGHVDSVQMGTGSRFTAFPPENATGNFVKIVQRVPVRIDIDSGLNPNVPLPLGASALPTVHLR
jgi:membrane fusion protein (multidrug efflux system)